MAERAVRKKKCDVSHGAGTEGSQNPVNACKRRVTTKTSSECRKQAIPSALTAKCIVILAAASKLIDPPSECTFYLGRLVPEHNRARKLTGMSRMLTTNRGAGLYIEMFLYKILSSLSYSNK